MHHNVSGLKPIVDLGVNYNINLLPIVTYYTTQN